jgi:hypothetical protein
MPPVGVHHAGVVRGLLWVAVAITLYTGLEYLHDGRRLLAGTAGPAGAA